ncbi:MAG: ATP-dependent Clp protease adapter ClpS [Acidobacteria bacterium]|nr:ATP-dependent Clp protease adapter ClpS [Acidobacteriota bacterium]
MADRTRRLRELAQRPAARLGAPNASRRQVTVAPDQVDVPDVDELDATAHPWQVVVWNDPVNLMSYVVWVFRKLFGHPETEATRLMLQVHHEGRAIVSSGPLEKAELDCHRLHHHGLWATLEKT